MSQPPPQSPLSVPSAGNRSVRPSALRPTQLMPAPHTTATASAAPVPARSSANASLSTMDLSAQPAAPTASVSVASSTGRSAPAR